MKKIITKLQNGLLALLATTVFCGGAIASTDVKFSLDWKFEGPSALFFTGLERGYYAASGLNAKVILRFFTKASPCLVSSTRH